MAVKMEVTKRRMPKTMVGVVTRTPTTRIVTRMLDRTEVHRTAQAAKVRE